MTHEQLLELAFQHASIDACDSRAAALSMPGTMLDYYLVIDGIRESLRDETWGDMTFVIESLRLALTDLAEVMAVSDDERAQAAKDRMQIKRGEE